MTIPNPLAPAPEMKITSLAPWFGGKRTLAPRIVKVNVVDMGLLGERPAARRRREAVPA